MRYRGQVVKLDDGHQLHVVTSGADGLPPLLMLHCWTGNWTQWERTMEYLDGKFRFIVPDQLGFGKSPKPIGDEHYQIDQQATRAYQVLQHFGYEKASVIGHSMGGMIALTLAGMYPAAVEKLIVCDPVVTGKTHPMTESLGKFLQLVRRGFPQPLEFLINVGGWLPQNANQAGKIILAQPEKYPEEARYWAYQVIADGQIHSSAWSQKALTDWDTTPLLSNITAPTLTLWGELDYTIPVSECDVLEQHIATIRVIRLADIGHFPMIEAWDTYIQAVEEFLT